MLKVIRRLRYMAQHGRMEAELAAEMDFHRAMKQQDLESRGLSAATAGFTAARELGSVARAREDSRAVWIAPWAESVWQDALYALRNLRRQPGFAVTAIATLALGLGLNTTLFAFFNGFALRPWPVSDPKRVVNVFEVSPARRKPDGLSLAMARHLNEKARSFSGVFAMRGTGVRLGDHASGKRSLCQIVTGNYYSVLGVNMAAGRGFLPEEDRAEAPQAVAVLSYPAWQTRFGSDRGIIGRTVRIDDVRFTVVGVSSQEFGGVYPEPVDVTIPMASLRILRGQDESTARMLTMPEFCCSSVAGRLAPGVTREQARAELQVLAAGFHRQWKQEPGRILLTGTAFLSHPDAKREFQPVFALMFLGVLLVLFLACANVGNLLLARAAARQNEIAVRLSLGAGRARVVRQLLTEGAVLAGAGAVVALLLSWRLPGYVFELAIGAPAPYRLTPDLTVVGYAILIAFAACIGFALAPALHGTRLSLASALKQQPALLRCRLPLRELLLGAQVAVSVLLLVSAGLLVRSVRHAADLDPGFAYKDVVQSSIELPADSYDTKRIRAFTDRLAADLAAQSVEGPLALTLSPPFGGNTASSLFKVASQGERQIQMARYHEVTSGYFEVLRIPIVAGRNFSPGDGNRRLILVNESMARRFWPHQNPIGKVILIPDSPPQSFGPRPLTREEVARLVQFRDSYDIIGIAKDVYTSELDRVAPTFYRPLKGAATPFVLTRDRPGSKAALEAVIAGIDARARVNTRPLSDNLDRYLQPARVGASIAFALGIVALSVASVGVFGVVAYLVQQRWKEIGTRIVLGARPAQVLWLVLFSSSRSALAGLALGLAASVIGSRLLQNQLYGIGHMDPATYLGATAVVLAASLAASFWPAWTATRIDPARAMRSE